MFGLSSFQSSISNALKGVDLLHPEQWEKSIEWKPFQPGVEIHRIYGDGLTGPAAKLLKFEAGGKIPWHTHTGYEHILVLAGSQSDEQGEVRAGCFMVNPPGSSHSVVSLDGCIVLVIYEKPVAFGAAE